MRRKPLALLVFVALVLAGSSPARAQQPAPLPPKPRPPELTPEAEEAIAAGARYLQQKQGRPGNWNGGEYPIAVTALCGLALLANGSTPMSGPYAKNVRDAVNYILRAQQRDGLIVSKDDSRYMYGHGFALLFLAECYGTAGNFEAARPLDKAIRQAIKKTSLSQTEDGGWYYTATKDEDEGSVTITQIQGLRAARNAGFRVEKRVIDRAINYIRRSQEKDGGVRYTARYGRSSLALTGAGLGVLFGAGDYDGKSVAGALDYIRAHMDTGAEVPHFHYTHFYLAQALHQQGGEDWQSYFPRIRAELLRTRSSDGSWSSTYGKAYATALSLLILEIPYRYLPIFER
jgi:hypothetical protein